MISDHWSDKNSDQRKEIAAKYPTLGRLTGDWCGENILLLNKNIGREVNCVNYYKVLIVFNLPTPPRPIIQSDSLQSRGRRTCNATRREHRTAASQVQLAWNNDGNIGNINHQLRVPPPPSHTFSLQTWKLQTKTVFLCFAFSYLSGLSPEW